MGDESVATPARTREDADAGVRRCIEFMTSGQWVTGKSHEDIAREFGVSPATVKSWATNASRIIRVALEGDIADIRARMLATLDGIVAKAMTKQAATMTGALYDAPDLRAAVAAVAEQAKILGFTTTMRVDLRPNVSAMSREEHRAELAKLADEIAAEQARIDAEVH